MVKFTDNFDTFSTSTWDLSGGVASAVNGVLSVSLPNTVIKIAAGSAEIPTTNTQKATAAFASLTQASDAFGLVWIRYDLSSLRFGYGLQIAWNADGSRTANLIKVNYITQALDIVATAAVTLIKHSGSDLGVLQVGTIQAADQPDGSVLIRGYVNEEDEGLPLVEFVDRGNGANNPPNRGVYSYGFAFGAANTVQLDTIELTDEYQQPGFGVYKIGHRTLGDLRTEMLMTLQGSMNKNNADSIYNAFLNQAVSQEISRLGDLAMFLRRFELMPIETNSAGLYVMSHNVDRVLDLFDQVTEHPVRFWLVGMENDGRLLLALDEVQTGNYWVRYMQRFQPMEADTDACAFPQRYDELVVLSASLRVVTANRDKELFGALTERYKLCSESVRSDLSAYNRQTKAQFFVDMPSPYHGSFKVPVTDNLLPYRW